MILETYSIFDRKAQVYHQPYYAHNAAHALRFYTVEFSKEATMLALFPADYDVVHTVSYDDSTGIHKPNAGVVVIVNSGQLVEDYKAALSNQKGSNGNGQNCEE